MPMEKELLRKQLELLAEQSSGATEEELARLSSAMVDVYDRLERPALGLKLCLTLLLLVLFNLIVSILILVK